MTHTERCLSSKDILEKNDSCVCNSIRGSRLLAIASPNDLRGRQVCLTDQRVNLN